MIMIMIRIVIMIVVMVISMVMIVFFMVMIWIRIRIKINSMIMIMIIIRRPSGEEGASAFRSLTIYKDLKKRVRERVRGPGRTRLNPGSTESLTGLSPF